MRIISYVLTPQKHRWAILLFFMSNIEFFTTKRIIKLSKRFFEQTVLYGFSPNKLDTHYARIHARVLYLYVNSVLLVYPQIYFTVISLPRHRHRPARFKKMQFFPLSALLFPYNTARYSTPVCVPTRDAQYLEPQRCDMSIFTIDTYAAHDRSDKIMYTIVFSFLLGFLWRYSSGCANNREHGWKPFIFADGQRKEGDRSVLVPHGTLSTYPYHVLFHIL